MTFNSDDELVITSDDDDKEEELGIPPAKKAKKDYKNLFRKSKYFFLKLIG